MESQHHGTVRFLRRSFSSASRPSRPRSHQDSVTRWPTAVATSAGTLMMMSFKLEGVADEVTVPRSLIEGLLNQDTSNRNNNNNNNNHNNNQGGLDTVRLPSSYSVKNNIEDEEEDEDNEEEDDEDDEEKKTVPVHFKKVETEICLICKRCCKAYQKESNLLLHQRSCYIGDQQRRGAVRIVQSRYICTLCHGVGAVDKNTTSNAVTDWRSHSNSVQHRLNLDAFNKMLQTTKEQQQQQQQKRKLENNAGDENDDDDDDDDDDDEQANPLIDEMEDVVNQITLLAARAAAESIVTTTTTTATTTITTGGNNNQDNNNGPDNNKRQKTMIQESTNPTAGTNAVPVAAAVAPNLKIELTERS